MGHPTGQQRQMDVGSSDRITLGSSLNQSQVYQPLGRLTCPSPAHQVQHWNFPLVLGRRGITKRLVGMVGWHLGASGKKTKLETLESHPWVGPGVTVREGHRNETLEGRRRIRSGDPHCPRALTPAEPLSLPLHLLGTARLRVIVTPTQFFWDGQ